MACGKCAGACGRAIYTWHLLKKCAHWPLDNAHSLILALFSGKRELILWSTMAEYFAVCLDTVIIWEVRLVQMVDDCFLRREQEAHFC